MAEPCNTELVATLTAAMAEPRRAEVDGQVAEAQRLGEIVKAAMVVSGAATNSDGRRRRGFKLLRVVPPGAVE